MAKDLNVDVDCLTFLHTVDSRKLNDGDILWTRVFKFDPPTDYRVRGRVTWIRSDEHWKIQLIPLPTQNIEQSVHPVKFTWTLSAVKGRKSQLQESRDISWDKVKKAINNAHNEYDVIDSIQVSQNVLETSQMAGADGSVTFMWFVELFLDHSQTSHTTKEKVTGNEQILAGEPSTSRQGFESSYKKPDSVYDTELQYAVSTPDAEKRGDSRLSENTIDSAINKQKKEKAVKGLKKRKLKQTEEQRKLAEQSECASDAEKNTLKEDSLAMSGAYEAKIKVILSTKIEETKEEEAQKWQEKLDKKDEDIAQLKAQYQLLYSRAKGLKAQAEGLQDELERAGPEQEDPRRIRLHCRDVQGNTVSVTILKTSPINLLMDAYCGMTRFGFYENCFVFDGKLLSLNKTPYENGLEEDDLIDVLTKKIKKGFGRVISQW